MKTGRATGFFEEEIITYTKEKLDKHYEDPVIPIKIVNKWFPEFGSGRTNSSEAELSGCPIEIANYETMEKIHVMVLDDRISYRYST